MSNVGLRRTMNNVGFFFKKNAPAIMTGVGVTATVAAVGIVAYKSYKELPEIVKDHKADLEAARTDVDPDTAKKQTLKVYGKTAGKLLKAYAIPAALLAGGITSIIKSDHVQTKRFNEVSAALALTGAAYDELKKRVANEIGEEALNDILMGADLKKKEKEIELVDPETNEKVKKKVKEYDGIGTLSMYAVQFNKVSNSGSFCNPNCHGEYFYDNWFCDRVYNMLVDKVKARGAGSILWLSEIYDTFGMTVDNGSITKEQALASRVVGFKYDPDKPMFTVKRVDKYVSYNDHPDVDIWIDFIGLDGNMYNKTYDELPDKI